MTEKRHKKEIVIVEDNVEVADLIVEVLSEISHYKPVAVHDGLDALKLIRTTPPDLILLDLKLPRLPGLQLYDLLRDDLRTCDIPVIFITANFQDPAFKRRNFSNVLPKPFALDELLARVVAALRPS